MRPPLFERFRSLYSRTPEFVARAPGRIEFIGNHADYNGGLVLGAALDRAVTVGFAPRTDGRRRLASDAHREAADIPASSLDRLSGPRSWANYPLGVLAALGEFGLPVPGGFDYLASSDLPEGAGLSSSAAIELASALAFLGAAAPGTPRELLAKLARHAENRFVGVPCGILDQGVSAFGLRDHLVLIDCREPRFETVPVPAGAHFWIFNTHTKHALIDGLYAERHRECEEAAAGLGVAFLAEATLPMLSAAETRMPRAPAKRARHIIDEIGRVRATVDALRAGDLSAVGRLLSASHRSSRTWFENSTPELDFLVERLGAEPSVFGARLTGGGFGGAVMALTSAAFGPAEAKRAVSAYADRFGTEPEALQVQTGDGARLIPLE